MKAIHRWQPTGFTPCGLRLDCVEFNEGQHLSDGVTCGRCLRATTLVSYLGRPYAPRRIREGREG